MVTKLVGTGRCLLLVNVIIDPSVVVAFLCSSVARSFTGMKVSVSRALDSVVVGLLTTVASLNLAVVGKISITDDFTDSDISIGSVVVDSLLVSVVADSLPDPVRVDSVIFILVESSLVSVVADLSLVSVVVEPVLAFVVAESWLVSVTIESPLVFVGVNSSLVSVVSIVTDSTADFVAADSLGSVAS